MALSNSPDHPPDADGQWDDVAVVIPCHNEATAIGKVVEDFRRALPGARIIVVDNASTDGTASVAHEHGADVVAEHRRGKGNALLRGFRAVEDQEYIVMVDGDGTYDAESARGLVTTCRQHADMVVATRLEQFSGDAFPMLHGIGNKGFVLLVRLLFGVSTRDLFSGYRVLRREMIRSLPLISRGFQIDAEISLQAIERGYRVAETAVPYTARIAGSQSKLRTFPDGYRILVVLLALFRDYRPLTCFGAIGASFFALGLLAGSLPVLEFLETGLVRRLPLAVLATGLVLLAAFSLVAGVVLSSVQRRAEELRVYIDKLARSGPSPKD